MTKWQDKNVGVLTKRGTSKRKEVRSETDGTRAGEEIEHWDGHQDAVVEPSAVHLKVRSTLEEDA